MVVKDVWESCWVPTRVGDATVDFSIQGCSGLAWVVEGFSKLCNLHVFAQHSARPPVGLNGALLGSPGAI